MARWLGYAAIAAVGVLGPWVAPAYTFQLAMLWLMILFALTWDMVGGQMGYNSLGNILFFGAGMYLSAVVQIGLYYDVAEYTAHFGAVRIDYTPGQYFLGLGLGIVAAAVGAVVLALALGPALFGLRGPYFAIGTLGVALAAGELVSTSDYLGGGGGITLPVYPGEPDDRALLFNALCFALAVLTFLVARWLYSTRFGLTLNAIRDDEDKAEAMGLRPLRYKLAAWSVSALFLGAAGAVFGNMAGFIEPREVAFPTVTFGIFMVVMTLLGGKGTLWGPVLGATLFHVLKETTWTYLLGWQWVALGAVIIVNIVFFQQGILGWAQERWPARFGIVVDPPRPARRPLATTRPQREGAE
jgi:branched-chain amino acid transport system permease protein